MNRFSARNYAWMAAVMIAGLSLQIYYVREMMASMVIFGLLFFALSLVMLAGFILWYGGKQVATWNRPASVPPEEAAAPLSIASSARP